MTVLHKIYLRKEQKRRKISNAQNFNPVLNQNIPKSRAVFHAPFVRRLSLLLLYCQGTRPSSTGSTSSSAYSVLPLSNKTAFSHAMFLTPTLLKNFLVVTVKRNLKQQDICKITFASNIQMSIKSLLGSHVWTTELRGSIGVQNVVRPLRLKATLASTSGKFTALKTCLVLTAKRCSAVGAIGENMSALIPPLTLLSNQVRSWSWTKLFEIGSY